MDKKIVLVAGKGVSTPIIYNALEQTFGVHKVILEEKEDTRLFLKRRVKKLGLPTVLGQLFFQATIPRILRKVSRKRIAGIIASNQLDTTPIPAGKLVNVASVNADQTLLLLQELQPDLVIVNGTRIISKKVLQAIHCKFINVHAGITPQYRGVHGTYWARTRKDDENCGVTVHYVDAGVDTGNIILQSKVSYTRSDNFVTYPLLQLAEGIKLLKKAVTDYFSGTLVERKATGNSRLWYHPTIWQYIYYRVSRKVK